METNSATDISTLCKRKKGISIPHGTYSRDLINSRYASLMLKTFNS